MSIKSIIYRNEVPEMLTLFDGIFLLWLLFLVTMVTIFYGYNFNFFIFAFCLINLSNANLQ